MKNKTNILEVGSDSVHFTRYLSEINKQGISFSVLSEEKIEEINVDYLISFRSLNPIAIIRNYRKLKKIIQQKQFQSIHIHQLNRLAYFVSRAGSRLGIPILSTAWGSDVLLIPQKNALFKWLIKRILIRSEKVTADSKQMIEAMNAIVPSEKKYIWLQYGIELIDGEGEKKEPIIYSNRLHNPLYRIDKIIDYFEEFSVIHPEWKLVVGATGKLTKSLKEKVEKSKLSEKVQFVGWIENEANKKWYKKAQIYISIPESDGTSVSLLEAMSAGCIPIVSNLPVSKEWIQNGKNGVISQVENPLFEALKIDKEKCKQINYSLVEKNASRKNCIAKFIELYRI